MNFDNPPAGWQRWVYRVPWENANQTDKRWLVQTTAGFVYCCQCGKYFYSPLSIAGHNGWHNRTAVAA